MFNQIRYILLLFLTVLTIVAVAQRDTSLTRTVEVTKAFKPTISDANKINEMPKIEESEHQVPKFDYNINSQPILSTFSMSPLKAATIESAAEKETGYGLVRLGVGNYNKPFAEFFFNNVNSKNSIFGIHAKHLSSFGKVTLDGGDKVDAPYSDSEAEIYYKYKFSKNVLSVNTSLLHNGFNYYGYPENPIPGVLLPDHQEITYQGKSQTFTKGGIDISLKNPSLKMDDPVFNFNMKYYYFGTKTGQREHLGEFDMDFRQPLNTGTILADVGFTFVQASEIYNRSLDEMGKRTQTFVFAKPAWYFEGEMASVSAGFNAWFIMDNDMDAQAKITPNVRVEFTPVEDVINLFAGVDGNYINNHYSKIAYENPYVDPLHDVKNSFEKIHFYGGFDGKFSKKTNFKIAADYSIIDDQQFYFLNEYYHTDPTVNPNPLIVNNAFDVLYDNVNLFKLNLEIFHTSSDRLNLLLAGNYYAYNLDEQTEAWNMPGWDANLSVNYKITEQLSVGTDIYLIGGRKALIVEAPAITDPEFGFVAPINKSYNLDTIFDLNVNATYQITQKFSAFGQLNNFGFQGYQRWFGYNVQSFNGLVGINYAF